MRYYWMAGLATIALAGCDVKQAPAAGEQAVASADAPLTQAQAEKIAELLGRKHLRKGA